MMVLALETPTQQCGASWVVKTSDEVVGVSRRHCFERGIELGRSRVAGFGATFLEHEALDAHIGTGRGTVLNNVDR